MNVETLRAFTKVVELGGVTKAARALRIAQPAISRKIHSLEKEIGKKLFVKNGRHLQVTPVGYQVFQHARSVLSGMEALDQLSQSLVTSKRLTVGASLTTLSQYLPQVVSKFREAHPEVQVSVQTGRSEEIYDMITDGRIEIGVVSAPSSSPYISTRPLFQDSCLVLCPSTHPLALFQVIEPQDLHNVALVTMTNHTKFRQDLNSIFATFSVKPRICMEIDNIDVIERMVESNLGITILPRSVWYRKPQSTLRSIPFAVNGENSLSQKMARHYSIIYLETTLSPEAMAWVETCRDVAVGFS